MKVYGGDKWSLTHAGKIKNFYFETNGTDTSVASTIIFSVNLFFVDKTNKGACVVDTSPQPQAPGENYATSW